MSRKRFFKTRSRRKESRTIPLRGGGVDEADENGQFYKCWHCGFTCDVERDSLGGDEESDGLYYENYSAEVYEGTPGIAGLSTLGGSIEHFQVALKLNSDGTPVAPELHIKAVVGSGCPFCGTRNWRGDY